MPGSQVVQSLTIKRLLVECVQFTSNRNMQLDIDIFKSVFKAAWRAPVLSAAGYRGLADRTCGRPKTTLVMRAFFFESGSSVRPFERSKQIRKCIEKYLDGVVYCISGSLVDPPTSSSPFFLHNFLIINQAPFRFRSCWRDGVTT